MGDEFSWNLNNLSVGGVDFGNDPTGIYGFKLDTGLGLRLDVVFAEGQLEIGDGDSYSSTLGVDSFDFHAPFEYNVSGGLNFNNNFKIRVGRFHYERSRTEGLINANAFQTAPNAALITAPLGWLGGELLYQTESESGILRDLLFRTAYYKSSDTSHFGVIEGMMKIAFQDAEDSPTLTLAGFGTVRPETPANEVAAKGDGTLFGQGGALVIQGGIFSGTVGVLHRAGSFEAAGAPTAVEDTTSATVALALEPGMFLFRGAYTYLSRSFSNDIDLEPPVGVNESHWEFTAGIKPQDWLLISLGYRGMADSLGGANQLFVGVQTSWGGSLPFHLTDPASAPPPTR